MYKDLKCVFRTVFWNHHHIASEKLASFFRLLHSSPIFRYVSDPVICPSTEQLLPLSRRRGWRSRTKRLTVLYVVNLRSSAGKYYISFLNERPFCPPPPAWEWSAHVIYTHKPPSIIVFFSSWLSPFIPDVWLVEERGLHILLAS